MKIKQKISFLLALAMIGSLAVINTARAATPTLALSAVSGDMVRVTVNGDASSNVQLTFLPTGASTVTSIFFGTTDSAGYFSTSISSGGYGVPSGSPVYVTVNGYQSSTMLWPTYSSSLVLSPTSLQVAVGESATVSGTSALIMPANGMSTFASASVSGSQATITGLSSGNGTINFCGANVGCVALPVTVGGVGQSQISFSKNNIVIYSGKSEIVSIFGGGNSGYVISTNSNPSAVQANISGGSSAIALYGNTTAGSAAISVCSASASTNCAVLSVTILNNSTTSLTFSQNNLSLIQGLTQNVTVSGGPDNNYYISSNSNSGVASVSISGNTLSVVGGSNSGTTVIGVCSATVNARCGNLNVTNSITNTSASATTLSFSQNVVSIAQGETSNVTVAGGTGVGYLISANSNPTAVTPSISGNSNVVTIYGNAVGTATVTVCSTSNSVTCASLYVTVGSAQSPIIFTQNNTSQYKISPTLGTKINIGLSGGSGSANLITNNSNSTVAGAALAGSGNLISLSANSVGSAIITICASQYSSNCATLYVTVSDPNAVVSNTTTTTTTTTNSGQVASVVITDSGEETPVEKVTLNFKYNYQYTANNSDIKLLQEFLIKMNTGVYAKALADYGANGNFGNLTKNALMEYQKANGLTASGKLDATTRAFINKLNYQLAKTITVKIGMLFRGNNKKIYVIVEGANKKLTKKYITSLKELAKYRGVKINEVSDTFLASY